MSSSKSPSSKALSNKTLAEDKITKSLRVIVGPNSVTLEDRELPWKYWMEIYRTPRGLARELRQIATWLEKL